jgi:hypothetical protein
LPVSLFETTATPVASGPPVRVKVVSDALTGVALQLVPALQWSVPAVLRL